MNLLEYSFGFPQIIDSTTRTSEIPKGGQLTILLKPTNKTTILGLCLPLSINNT